MSKTYMYINSKGLHLKKYMNFTNKYIYINHTCISIISTHRSINSYISIVNTLISKHAWISIIRTPCAHSAVEKETSAAKRLRKQYWLTQDARRLIGSSEQATVRKPRHRQCQWSQSWHTERNNSLLRAVSSLCGRKKCTTSNQTTHRATNEAKLIIDRVTNLLLAFSFLWWQPIELRIILKKCNGVNH